MAYCIDSSALIDAWRDKYPPDFLPSLWDDLSALITSGELFAPEDVKEELRRGGDDLFDWAKDRGAMFHALTDPIQARVDQIVNTYPSFVPTRVPDGVWADPYVIALAQETGAAVVSSEKLAPENARHLKIPNVCTAMGVRCLDLLRFFRDRGWKY